MKTVFYGTIRLFNKIVSLPLLWDFYLMATEGAGVCSKEYKQKNSYLDIIKLCSHRGMLKLSSRSLTKVETANFDRLYKRYKNG